MKNQNLPVLLAAMTLTTLTACDYVPSREFQRERADRLYQAAMDDFRAGRLTQAIEVLKKVCEKDPTNSSARFQLACLLQDSAADYLGATCAFREFLLQQPESDKVELAKSRLADCEKKLAEDFANKFLKSTGVDVEKNLSAAKEVQRTLTAKNDELAKALDAAQLRIAAFSNEVARLKKQLAPEGTEDTTPPDQKEIATAEALLAESESDRIRIMDNQEVEAAKKLLSDDSELAAKPMITQAPDAKEKREAARQAKREANEARHRNEPKHEPRPDVYVVQPGDTLYKIAIRFYGRSSAWNLIREANRATITPAGRLRAGQKLVLPAE